VTADKAVEQRFAPPLPGLRPIGLADSTGSIINLLSTAGLLVLPSQSSLFAGDGLSLGLAFNSYFSLFGFDLNL